MANSKHIASETTSVMFNAGFNSKRKSNEDIFLLFKDSIEPLFNQIAEKAKANLGKNKSVDTSALQSAIAVKYQNRTRQKKTWIGVGIDAKVDVVETRKKSKSGKAAARRVPVRYAHFIEKGFTHVDGVKVDAKPFLAPAVASIGGEAFILKKVAEVTNRLFDDDIFQEKMISEK